MARFVTLIHDYAAPPEALWALVTDYACLAQACRRYVRFEGLPEGRCFQGQVVDVKVRLFGIFPAKDYRMELRDVDEANMRVRSHEFGAGVDTWRHEFWITPTPQGCCLEERIEIEAGWRTPLFVAWAKLLYRGRHRPRLAMLAKGMPDAA